MKLYYFPTDNSLKVLAVAYQLGIDLELERVNLIRGEQLSPEYLALNPNHMAPTLVDGEFVLWESNAIMQYLSDTRTGVGTLWPADPQVRADVSRWQCWQLAHWGPPCGTLVFERIIKSMASLGEPDAAEVAKAEESFHTYAKVLNRHLKGRTWLVGDELTLADFSVGAPLTFTEPAQLPVQPYPEIQRWYEGLKALDSWRQALAHADANAPDSEGDAGAGLDSSDS